MKTIRSFFLFSADEPFSVAFFITLMIGCVLTFLGIGYMAIAEKAPDWSMILKSFIVLFLFWLILGIVSTIVAKKKITVMHLDEYHKGFILYPNGKK